MSEYLKPRGEEDNSLHPVSQELIQKTERREVKRGEGDGYGETIWKLLKGEEVQVTYSAHYQIYIKISPDGSGVIEDGSNGIEFAFTNWDVSEWSSSGEREYILDVKAGMDFINRVANTIPSGNLELMGGIPGLVQSYLDVRSAEKYAQYLEEHPASAETHNWRHDNIPTPGVTARLQTE